MTPTEWDAATYDRSSGPQQDWAGDVLDRLGEVGPDAVLLDVGCGTGRVTARLAELWPGRRLLAIDASQAMVDAAAEQLGTRAEVWRADALDVSPPAPVDVLVSTATLHWVPDHDALWEHLFAILAPGGRLEVQCGGAGNIANVRRAIEAAAKDVAPELLGWSPWTFATPAETEPRLRRAGFEQIACGLVEKPSHPDDVAAFVRTSILPAHFARLASKKREVFAEAVLERTTLPLDYVRLNVSAVKPDVSRGP